MRIKVVRVKILGKISEHGTVIHVVSIKESIRIAEVITVLRLDVDRSRKGRCLVHIVIGVVDIIQTLNDRIVDVSIVNGDPAGCVRDIGKKRVDGNDIALHLGLILDHLGAVSTGLHILVFIEHISGKGHDGHSGGGCH